MRLKNINNQKVLQGRKFKTKAHEQEVTEPRHKHPAKRSKTRGFNGDNQNSRVNWRSKQEAKLIDTQRGNGTRIKETIVEIELRKPKKNSTKTKLTMYYVQCDMVCWGFIQTVNKMYKKKSGSMMESWQKVDFYSSFWTVKSPVSSYFDTLHIPVHHTKTLFLRQSLMIYSKKVLRLIISHHL